MKNFPVKLTLEEENKLLEGCLCGDQESINRFAFQYTPLMLTFIRKTFVKKGYYDKLGSNDYQSERALEEFYQDFFLKKFVQNDFIILRKFDHTKGASLATWIRTVVINFTKDYISSEIRKECTMPKIVSMEDPIGVNGRTIEGDISDNGDLPTNEIIRKEELGEIEDAIEDLKGIKKEIVKLFFIEGCDLGEIAKKLGVSIDTIYSRKSEAVKELRKKLKKPVSFQ